jgi:ABC-2 type transport system ATP-binding protein
VGLLGPNGSGKSTLMRCLVGYLAPTAGRVRIGGVDIGEDPVGIRRRVGYLPEQVTLYPELTVRRYLAFVGGMKGLDRRTTRSEVARVVDACGLGEVASQPTGRLSKGFRQRVGLAQALLGTPDLLVLDEPTVGLDPVQTVELRALLRGLGGATVLLSTHLLAEASQLCGRVLVLKGGCLLADDTPGGLARRLAWTRQLVIRVDGPVAAVREALAGLRGVAGVKVDARAAADDATYRVYAERPEDVQRHLAATVVERGWTLLEVRVEEPTLEDLFVRTVG